VWEGFEASSKLSNGVHCDFTILVLVKLVLVKTGNGGKEPTPNPSQEGNNPCHPVTRLNKMKFMKKIKGRNLPRHLL